MAITPHVAVSDDQIGPQEMYVDSGYVDDGYVMGHVDPSEITTHEIAVSGITEH